MGSLYDVPKSSEPCASINRPKFVSLDWYLTIEKNRFNYNCEAKMKSSKKTFHVCRIIAPRSTH